MRMYDVIKKKRDGFSLTKEEIDFFVKGYTEGAIPDYQVSALLMAIYAKDMTIDETKYLTYAIRDSGEKIDFSVLREIIVDKHSTGGVGDGTSLVVAPIAAACGAKVAMVAGRGLGHTGGTLDKLETIPGFKTRLTNDEFIFNINKNGLAIMGQSEKMAPADKKLYALRDVTATVEKIPLIASSIMGKKLAEGSDALVLDVKTGSGAFLKSYSEAQMLANTMYQIAEESGKKACILITNMDEPLGNTIGNSLEVIQAIATLKDDGPADFKTLCIELAANMLRLSEKGSMNECRDMALKSIENGSAFKKFRDMVAEQGGDASFVDHPERIRKAKYYVKIRATKNGFIQHQDAEKYGTACCLLGAGRMKVSDTVDPYAGIVLYKKYGDFVQTGDTIAILYSDNESCFSSACAQIRAGTVIGDAAPQMKPLIFKRIGR